MNTRREKFCQYLVTGMTKEEAFVKAGYRAKTGNSRRVRACELAQIMAPRIQELIGASPEALKADTRKILEDSIDAFRRDVPRCRWELIDDDKTADYVRLNAIKECLARGLGLPIQYVEQNVNVRYQVSDTPMTDEEWAREFGAETIDAVPEPRALPPSKPINPEPTEH
jgi:hypothetical protein